MLQWLLPRTEVEESLINVAAAAELEEDVSEEPVGMDPKSWQHAMVLDYVVMSQVKPVFDVLTVVTVILLAQAAQR